MDYFIRRLSAVPVLSTDICSNKRQRTSQEKLVSAFFSRNVICYCTPYMSRIITVASAGLIFISQYFAFG